MFGKQLPTIVRHSQSFMMVQKSFDCIFCCCLRQCSRLFSVTRNSVTSVCGVNKSQKHLNSAVKRHYTPHRFVDGNAPPGFRSRPPWRVLFFGTDDFSLRHLDALVEIGLSSENQGLIDSLEVVTNSAKSVKPSPVYNYAVSKGLTVHSWPMPPDPNRYDVGVIASFGHLIPTAIIDMFPYGILNVHPSILPRWRGASPIIHTLLHGDPITGVSIMDIRPKKFDIGPLLLQQKISVHKNITANQLSYNLASLGAHMLIITLENLPYLELAEREQDRTGITYAHKIVPMMANIDWNNQTCFNIDCQYRALHEMMRLRSEYKNQPVHLLDMVAAHRMESTLIQELFDTYPNMHHLPCGWPHFSKRHKLLCIKCKDGWVGFKNIVIQKPMTAESFFNGFLSKKENFGTVFKSIPNHLNEDIYHERIRVIN